MGFQRKGRNPSGNELPNVASGGILKASDINSLATGIDRSTLRSGKGYTFVQSSGGTSINIKQEAELPPWGAYKNGKNLCIRAGNVWGKGVSEMPKHTAKVWGTAKADFLRKFWTARPVMIGVEGANIASTDEINADIPVGSRAIVLPIKEGTYYIEYGNWDSSDGKESQGGVATSLSGTEQFVLRHKPKATPPSPTENIVIVCYVDENGMVFQGAVGDIWWGGDTGSHPFKISVRKVENTWKIFVDYGTVNNLVPDYATGGEVGDDNAGMTGLGSGNSVSGVREVYMRMKYEEDEPFPIPYPEVLNSAPQDITPTDETFYLVIGRVTAETEGSGETARPKFTIEQAVSGSLWVERFKMGDNDAIYWATKI